MLKLKVINLFGAPGIGKSTLAAGLFNLMKMNGLSVELVGEYAKDLTWSKDWMGLSHQPSVLAQQDYRIRRLEGQVEWAITDSPLPCQLAYCGEEWGGLDGYLSDTTWGLYDRYLNFNVLLHRSQKFEYQSAGRNQDLTEAMKLDNVMDHLFGVAEETAVRSLELTPDNQAVYKVFTWLTSGREV